MILRVLISAVALSIALVGEAESLCRTADAPDFSKPEPLYRAPPVYPLGMVKKANAGMVELSMMIDKKGKVFAPIVRRSSNPSFEKSALEAVSKYQYEPALLNGQPVDSHSSMIISYFISDSKDASSKEFRSRFRFIRKELGKEFPNKEKIEKRLNLMTKAYNLNDYAIAYMALARSLYANKFGDKFQQLEALRSLRTHNYRVRKKGGLFGEEMLSNVIVNIVQLELQLGNLNEAIESYSKLEEINTKLAQEIAPFISKARKILCSGESLSRSISLGDRGYEEVLLNSATFSFVDISGGIDELRFRCERAYSAIKFAPESEYQVPGKWGSCWLQLVGKEQTKATLIQF